MILLNAAIQLIKRDFRLAVRAPQELINPLIFFLIVVSLFPLAISPNPKTLQLIGPGVIWVAALLATLLSLDRLFLSDYQDGSLEQLLLSPHPLTVLVSVKVLTHWLLTGLPLIILSPLLGMMLGMPSSAIVALMLSLLIGTPLLSFVGAIGSALTVGLRGGGVLLTLLVLPLYIPVLIFGSSAVVAAMSGLPYVGHLASLGAFLAMAVTLAPLATAAALRICVSY